MTTLIDKHFESVSTYFLHLMPYGLWVWSVRMREGLIHWVDEGSVLGWPWKELEGLTVPVYLERLAFEMPEHKTRPPSRQDLLTSESVVTYAWKLYLSLCCRGHQIAPQIPVSHCQYTSIWGLLKVICTTVAPRNRPLTLILFKDALLWWSQSFWRSLWSEHRERSKLNCCPGHSAMKSN